MTGPTPDQPGQNPEHAGGQPAYGQQPYSAPGQPQYGQPQAPQYGQPQAPQYGQPQAPQYGQPQAPQYGQPQPPHGQPQAPQGQPQYGQAQYGEPQQPYGQPQAPQYGQPQQFAPDQYGQQYAQQQPYGQPQYGQAQYGQPQGLGGLSVGAGLSPRIVQLLWGAVGAAVVLLIASFLPWASVGNITVSGTGDGKDGIFTLLLALIAGAAAAAALFLTVKQPQLPLGAGIAAAVAGVLSTIIAIVDIVDIRGTADDIKTQMSPLGGAYSIDISVGFGLWLTLVAAIALTAVGGAIIYFRKQGA